MADWPPTSGARIITQGVANVSTGITVTASATPNTKGSWSTLVAATNLSANSMGIIARFDQAASHLLDIGTGPSGSETIVIADLHYSGELGAILYSLFPLAISFGGRIAARLASSTASATASVSTQLIAPSGFDLPVPRFNSTTYGANSATSGGTSIDPGGTPGSFGSYSQMTAATTRVHKMIAIAVGNQNNPAPANAQWRFDVGIGAAGSEVGLIQSWRVSSNTNGLIQPIISPFFPVSLPEGSRLAVRSHCNTNDATDRLLDAVLYCAV